MGLRYRPFAFTEQGAAMLSTVLNSEQAINGWLYPVPFATKSPASPNRGEIRKPWADEQTIGKAPSGRDSSVPDLAPLIKFDFVTHSGSPKGNLAPFGAGVGIVDSARIPLGKVLLKDAILRTTQASEIAGLKLLLVHDQDQDAADFYQMHGF